jgi:hypothetical protein
MLENLSHSLLALPGYTGHIEIDFEWNLSVNTTSHDHATAAKLSGTLIGYLRTYESDLNPVKSISIVCGHFVYFSHKIPTGYLVLQLSKNQSLAGVRRALYEIFGETECPVFDPVLQTARKVLPQIPETGPLSSLAGLSSWPDFRTELLKLLSPIAPANIILRLIDNAFVKVKIPVGSQPMNFQIYDLALAILNEIPNPARRKAAEKGVLKLLETHQISPN